jgi:hypothetical protein
VKDYVIFVIKDGKSCGSHILRADDIDHAAKMLVGNSTPGTIKGVPFTARFADSADYRVFVHEANSGIVIAASYIPHPESALSLDVLFANHFARKRTSVRPEANTAVA